MKKFIALLVAVGVAGAAVAATSDYTPSSEEDTSAAITRGAATFTSAEVNGDVVLANDETIDNATDAQVQITFDDDAVVLGTVKIESENAAANIAAGDELRADYAAQNDATQEVTYARVVVDLTDETDTTEDGTYEVWVMVNGTLTKIASVDASGLTVVGDVSGTTIGGITEANLLDKSATETVAGSYTFSNAAIIMSNLPTSTNGLATGTLWNNSNVLNIKP